FLNLCQGLNKGNADAHEHGHGDRRAGSGQDRPDSELRNVEGVGFVHASDWSGSGSGAGSGAFDASRTVKPDPIGSLEPSLRTRTVPSEKTSISLTIPLLRPSIVSTCRPIRLDA